MVRDAPQAALLTMRVQDFAAKQDLILRCQPKAGVSKDGPQRHRLQVLFKCDSSAFRAERGHQVCLDAVE